MTTESTEGSRGAAAAHRQAEIARNGARRAAEILQNDRAVEDRRVATHISMWGGTEEQARASIQKEKEWRSGGSKTGTASRWGGSGGTATGGANGGGGGSTGEFGDLATVRRFAEQISALGDGSDFALVIKACAGLKDMVRDLGGDMNREVAAFVDTAVAVAREGEALRDQAAQVAGLARDMSGQ